MTDILNIIKNAVIEGKHSEINDLVKKALQEEIDPNVIINNSLISAMDVVGINFGSGKIFVPEMLVSAVTMKNGLEILKPLLVGDQTESRGTVMMATVKGDIHDIGKNLVSMMLEGAGFRIVDLGTDISIEKLIDKIKEIDPQVLGLSSLLTTSMFMMKQVIEELEIQGLRKNLKVMIGGPPVDQIFAEKIGADGYGANATEAVGLARRFTR
jgi:5-methyltetrahydrofolate--homocysteine methyltransferase